ncbi:MULTISPECIES: hypothetical protein [Pseudonocardia]|uniref:hypothetical protein n=1 Tax=Pseudonocardia TaxID=1847 RepID=UPI0020443B48|nr:hypothetical protein [Pseudonocardia sp. DR1-2]MCM3844659.1 hypothetical protein [Pseudonocardia sp. DR1-2]WFG45637.1 hypothetical protein PaSha_21785 [Pseudonocardia alni]
MIVVVRGWRWIGGAAVAVLALLALLSWVRWAGLPADVAVPATTGGPVAVTGPGTRWVYLETRSGYGSADALPTVTGPSGPVPLVPATMDETYSVGARSGFLIGSFEVDEPGVFTLSAAPGARGIGVALVVAAAGIAPLILAILTTVAAGVGAIVLLVLVLVLRRRPPRTAPPPWTVH